MPGRETSGCTASSQGYQGSSMQHNLHLQRKRHPRRLSILRKPRTRTQCKHREQPTADRVHGASPTAHTGSSRHQAASTARARTPMVCSHAGACKAHAHTLHTHKHAHTPCCALGQPHEERVEPGWDGLRGALRADRLLPPKGGAKPRPSLVIWDGARPCEWRPSCTRRLTNVTELVL